MIDRRSVQTGVVESNNYGPTIEMFLKTHAVHFSQKSLRLYNVQVASKPKCHKVN